MSMRPDERISFVLSDLQRGNQRRRAFNEPDIESRSAAAVAGAYERFDDGVSPTHVDVHRDAPPKLRSRRPCCTTVAMLWCAATSVAACMFALQAVVIHGEESATHGLERRLARDGSIRAAVRFGIWDSKATITPLQLQVSVSVALGVRAADDDIDVRGESDHFFLVTVQHATVEESEYIGSQQFLASLNVQLENYGGSAVLSRPPTLLKNATV
jgi:hypothetical protein